MVIYLTAEHTLSKSEKLENLWGIFSVFIFLVNFCTDIFYLCSDFFASAFQYCIFALDFIFLLLCIFKKSIIKKPIYILAGVFIIWYCICRRVYSAGYYPVYSDAEVLSLLIGILCIALPFSVITRKQKYLDFTLYFIMILFGILVFLTIVPTFSGTTIKIPLINWTFGLNKTNIFSINGLSLYTSSYLSLFGLWLSVYFISKKKFVVIDSILIIGFFFILTVTKCRGTLAALFFSALLIGFIYIRCKHADKSFMKCIPYALIILAALILLIAVMWEAGGLINKYFIPEHGMSEYMQRKITSEIENGSGRTRIAAKDIEAFENGMPKSLFFGNGYENLLNKLRIHCGYITVLLYCGIPGLIMLFIFAFNLLRIYFKASVKKYSSSDEICDYILYAVPLAALISMILENFTIFEQGKLITSVPFLMFLTAGYVFEYNRISSE